MSRIIKKLILCVFLASTLNVFASTEEFRITVLSSNPSRLEAIKKAIPINNAEVIAWDSNKGNKKLQPVEILENVAENMKHALEETKSTICIAIEEVTLARSEGVYVALVGSLTTNQDQHFLLTSSPIKVPAVYAKKIQKDVSLDKVLSQQINKDQSGKNIDPYEILTKGFITQNELISQMVLNLLGQYLYFKENPEKSIIESSNCVKIVTNQQDLDDFKASLPQEYHQASDEFDEEIKAYWKESEMKKS